VVAVLSGYLERYHAWLRDPYFDQSVKEELQSIRDDDKEIEDRFYKDLAFGTGGIRGLLGAGTNRINRYTIRRAAQGLANTILNGGLRRNCKTREQPSAVIAYDSRHQSAELAKETALCLAANGITAYLFTSLRPTPELSFAVRHLKANAGVMLTASHNPPQYNGFKVYAADGGQIVPEEAELVTGAIEELVGWSGIKLMNEAEAVAGQRLIYMDTAVDDAYLKHLLSVLVRPEVVRTTASPLRIVYSPLHGTGHLLVKRALALAGYQDVYVVPEQQEPDPDFSTVDSPNPEDFAAFALSVQLAKRVRADICIATDPDADRIGVVVRTADGRYLPLTGNQLGALLLQYLLQAKQEKGVLPLNGVVVKTVVTSELGRVIARSYGIETLDTLTGFKYIGEKMNQFEREPKHFLFGYEESYGYLAGGFVRDKDGVMTALLVGEMAQYYRLKGQTLFEVLEQIYRKYGYYREALYSITLEGKAGAEKIEAMMRQWREHPPVSLPHDNASAVVRIQDFLAQREDNLMTGESRPIPLRKENVLKFIREDGSWLCLRPSGTEPKLKIYVSICADSAQDAQQQIEQFNDWVTEQFNASI
jgi:phosphoglucomutase